MAPEISDHIIIVYKNKSGKNVGFKFNGQNAKEAPNNKFVKDFITAYNYNIKNGGGDNLKVAAKDKNNNFYLPENENSRAYKEPISERNVVLWNPFKGLKVDNGDILSPATILEHEFDHSVHSVYCPEDMEINMNLMTNELKEYDNFEEYRVISGSETKQAKLNGEISKGREQSRYSHRSGDRTNIKSVRVESPTSNKEIKK